jgi:hypothetical protein
MYIDDLCSLVKVPESLKDTLLLLLQKLDFEGYITLSPRFRKSMCEVLGIVNQTLRNRLRMLTQSGLLINEGTNEYQVNSHYFARGSWKDIQENRKAFSVTITYSQTGGRKIKTEVINEESNIVDFNNKETKTNRKTK